MISSFGRNVRMALYRHGTELLPERREITGSIIRHFDRSDYASRIRRGKRFARLLKRRLTFWMFVLAVVSLIYLSVFDVKLPLHGKRSSNVATTRDRSQEGSGFEGFEFTKPKHRKQHFPCEVKFLESVDKVVEPMESMNFEQFSLNYVDREENFDGIDAFEPRFGGHQTLEERENTFYARNQTMHCGFVKGLEGSPSTGYDLDLEDKEYMNTCHIVVSSCIFGSSDFLRRPTSRKISEYSKKNVCFVMFLDEHTISKLSSEGHVRDDRGYIGLWKIVIVRNLPYVDMRRTGKVPKFLSHRLFPSARFSIWLDSKMRLHTDPMLILEYFLFRNGSEYAISNHYDRHCVWEEVLQNKRLNKYNHSAIDEQFNFYQSDGLTKFDPSDPDTLLPSYVPEGSFIVRAHTPMSNLFSCLWFNEVDRFTSRDQLSFAYTYLKLRRKNPDKPFFLNMFKITGSVSVSVSVNLARKLDMFTDPRLLASIDCERRALAKLFRHRTAESPPPPNSIL